MDPEMSDGQAGYILRLLDSRRVSARKAAKIIDLLEEEPPMVDNGQGAKEWAEWMKNKLNEE